MRETEETPTEGFEFIGQIELNHNEKWKSAVNPSVIENGYLAIDAPNENLQSLKDIRQALVIRKRKYDTLYSYYYKEASGVRRNKDGKPVSVHPAVSFLKNENPDDYIFLTVAPLDEDFSIKEEAADHLDEWGYYVWELEVPIQEDEDTIYYFIMNETPYKKADGFYTRVMFTKDFLGKNLPAWFVTDQKWGGYPERVQNTGWDLESARQELREKPYVLIEWKLTDSNKPKPVEAPKAEKLVEKDMAADVSKIYAKFKK